MKSLLGLVPSQQPFAFGNAPVDVVTESGALDAAFGVDSDPGTLEGVAAPETRSLIRRDPSVTLDRARVDSHLVAFWGSDPAAAEQYKRLVATMISLAAKGPLKRVLITSAKHGEGRTCVLLNVAAGLAQAQRRVLVIDSDLSRPSVLRLLGADVPLGLHEALASGLPFSEVAVRVLPFGFNLLATRSRIENSVEVLSSPSLRTNLQLLESDYDFILFDSSPLLVRSEAQLLLNLVDKALLVIRPGMTTPAQMARALAMFSKQDLFGVVINRNASRSSYE